MNDIKKKGNIITINNYLCLTYDKFLKLTNSQPLPIDFQYLFNNPYHNLSQIKKENMDYKIIKQNISFSINNKENKNDENIIPQEKTKDLTIEIQEEEKLKFEKDKKVFIVKGFKRKGRKHKNSLIKGYHTKYSHDNILRKIKVKFFKKLVKYINNIIKNKYWRKVHLLKPLHGKISQNNTKIFNRTLINTKLKDIFSSFEINGKFKSVDKEYNKIVIKSIYEKNLAELINIFEMTFLEAFYAFLDKNKTEKLQGLEKLDVVVEEIKKKEDDVYAMKFQKVAMDFEKYYLTKNCKKKE